ncbi:hypothetical protein [Limoniibacter endophyticus]|uniref:hypothetical protein n=1 Tax=Limoniibacter endophyticus TaxID=1565040 RepID=UPI00167657FF|nr:hypothetical protein [Limoniibacter endophyticus]
MDEFKAWLEGFETAMNGNPPTAEQWSRIKEKIQKLSGTTQATSRIPLPNGWNDRMREFDLPRVRYS